MTGMTGESPANLPEPDPTAVTDAPPPAPPMATPQTAVEDLGAIAPVPGEPFEIGSDSPEGPVLVRVSRLKTIEMLALLRAIAAGVGPAIGELEFSEDTEENIGLFVGLLISGMGDAGPEIMEFLRLVVKPVAQSDKDRVRKEMVNPDPGDTLDIIERLVTQEMPDFEKLLGKAQAMFSRVQTTYRRTRSG